METKKKRNKLGIVAVILVLLIILVGIAIRLINNAVVNSEQKKYGGHGFEYMDGWSSTDLTGYHVYDGEKLATLDEPATLQIDDVENMPVLDGAEACYPLYAAVAREIYTGIADIELEAKTLGEEAEKNDEDYINTVYFDYMVNNGRVVTFTNTVSAYYRLVYKEVDLVFGASPSQGQKEYAADEGEEIVPIPIGKEAFVFFVEEDNPVDDLTADQIRQIYSGEITNWSELGGLDQEIMAFQRPEESGSQVMMKYFMGDTTLMEPDKYSYVDSMVGVIEEVKQYHNEKGALGYTFQYFLTGLQQEKGVKMLSVDGVYPSVENIKNGTYPIIVNLVCAKLESNDDPYVNEVVNFLLSPQGQELIEKTGYGPLTNDEI